MKQPFGAKPAGFCMRSMRWIAVNRKKEDAASASMIGETCRRPSAAIVEFGAVEQFGAALPKALFILAPAGLLCSCLLGTESGFYGAAGEKI